MPSKQYAKAVEKQPERYDDLPTNRPVAVYYRQSTEKQLGNEQTGMQKEDLPRQLVEMGWSADKIIVIDDDQAVSGTLDIDQRVGMTRLFDLIRNNEIGAVAIVSENRAFRDQYLDQAATFARVCAEHRVIVIVPGVPNYVFHDPRYGDMHRELFLRACKEGHNFIKHHIQGKMLGARRRKAKRGEWTGGAIPLGFMLDLATDKFVIYEPAAVVIRAWFLLCLKFGGNIARTWRHIRDSGPYLPDFGDSAIYAALPRNEDGTPKYLLQKPYVMKPYNGHYYPSRTALTGILTNAAYIGVWTVSEWEYFTRPHGGKTKGKRLIQTTVIRNNHPAIVPEDVFNEVFNYLSKVTIDGEPNSSYHPPRVTRPKNTDDPHRATAPRPFLDGKLYFPDAQGNLQHVPHFWNSETGKYEYKAMLWRNGSELKLWSKSCEQIDAIAHELLSPQGIERHDEIAAMLEKQASAQAEKDFDGERTRYQELLKQEQKELVRAKVRWENSGDEPDLVKEAVAAYKKIGDNIKRYQEMLANIDKMQADAQHKAEMSKQLFRLMVDYNTLSDADQRLVLELCVQMVTAEKVGNDLRITVWYRGAQWRSRVIALRGAKGSGWTEAERQRLRTLGEQHAPALQIAASFPHRTWAAIVRQYLALIGQPLRAPGPMPRRHESYTMFILRQPLAQFGELSAAVQPTLNEVMLELSFIRLIRPEVLQGVLDQRRAEGWIMPQGEFGTSDSCS